MISRPRVGVDRVVRALLQSVEDGDLVLFDQLLERSTGKPDHVEYIYTTRDRLPTMAVYSALRTPIPFPMRPGVQIKGVSAVLHMNERIVDTVVHCGD